MIVTRISYDNADIHRLITELDRYQIGLYGEEHCNLESVEVLRQNNAFLAGALLDGRLVGMGAVKLFPGYAEIKRMYVEEAYRSAGVAADILVCLEGYVWGMGVRRVCLETGRLQVAAIRFYEKSGYRVIKEFGHYRPNGVSRYFFKDLTGDL